MISSIQPDLIYLLISNGANKEITYKIGTKETSCEELIKKRYGIFLMPSVSVAMNQIWNPKNHVHFPKHVQSAIIR